ncbi:MAG: hypothetical protein MZU95_02830 [Desulfomicrobium escambiense]|nr:hypothetical protein [Desulfomicrobium escambiense]
MATVATGTPFGIMTRAEKGIETVQGTSLDRNPDHGKPWCFAATAPARCAARPAAAMITFSPREAADREYSATCSGVL